MCSPEIGVGLLVLGACIGVIAIALVMLAGDRGTDDRDNAPGA